MSIERSLNLPIVPKQKAYDDTFVPSNPLKDAGVEGFMDKTNVSWIKDEAWVNRAEQKLLDAGYVFIGYHGTNQANFLSMCREGIQKKFCGSGAGEAKGSGFYVARSPDKAKDYAQEMTQAGDPVPIKEPPYFKTSYHEGSRGIPALIRVYAKNFEAFTTGIDVAWGLEASDGDPNGDKKYTALDSKRKNEFITDNKNKFPGKLDDNLRNLEMVISPNNYSKIAVLPSFYDVKREDSQTGEENNRPLPREKENILEPMASWPSHDV